MLLGFVLLSVVAGQPVLERNPATVSDLYALEANPAGLSFIPDTQMRLLTTVSLTSPRANVSARAAYRLGDALVLGGQASWVPTAKDSWAFVPGLGAGLQLDEYGLGFSWTDGLDGNIWRYGLSVRPWTWLSTSVSAVDFESDDLADAYDFGIGLRPFESRHFTLSARWRYQDELGLRNDNGKPDIELRVDVEPIAGLFISASSDLHANLYGELGLSFGEIVMRSVLGTNGQTESWGMELALSSAPTPSITVPTKVVIAELSGSLKTAPRFSRYSHKMSANAFGRLPLFLAAAEQNKDVSGVFLKIGRISSGWGTAAEVRDGISRIRASKKRVDCYLSAGSDLAYYIAAACDSITSPPSLIVNLNGLTAESTYLADFLDDLGIDVNVMAAGKYKSAPEQFSRTGMSSANREAVNALLDTIYDELVVSIGKNRSISREDLVKLIKIGTQTATEAQSAKLIDRVAYLDEMKKWLRTLYAVPIEFSTSGIPTEAQDQGWGGADKIAVVSIDAQITGGSSEELPFGLGRSTGARTIIRALQKAKNDSSIRAVVLRVDTPGGDAFASDLIARAVQQLAAQKPVIASFGDVAASGGYYAATSAHAIYAEPTTITGSIGVFSVNFSAEALRQKLGVNVDVIKRGSDAQQSSVLRTLSDEERRVAHREVQAVYRQFIQAVAEGRKMKIKDVEKNAQGRVWSGQAALARGLIDEIGGFNDAFMRAKAEAGIAADAPVVVLQRPTTRSGLSRLLDLASLKAEEPDTAEPFAVRKLKPWMQLLMSDSPNRIMAMMPFGLEID